MRSLLLFFAIFFQPIVHDPIAAIDDEINKLKQGRIHARLEEDIAGREADRYAATNDWTHYRQAMQKQEHFRRQIRAYDARILALEKQKISLQTKKS